MPPDYESCRLIILKAPIYLSDLEATRKMPEMPKPEAISHRLEKHLFKLGNAPGKPVTLLSFMGHPICTVGNISNIQGPAKSAKSAVLGAMMAATVKALAGIPTNEDAEQGALLGFTCDLEPDPKESVILHFDTEQSAYDHHHHVKKALERMGATLQGASKLPLLSYSLLEFSADERKQAIRLIIESLRERKIKFPCIFLDGVADIVSDPNNFEESAKLVDWFHRLAGENQCTVITVLHENPSATDSGSGKTRGHLGSQIERKSETNLRVAKDRAKNKQGVLENMETSTIWADRARHCYIPRNYGIQICYNQEAKRHEIVTRKNEPKGKTTRGASAQRPLAVPEIVQATPSSMPTEELTDFLENAFADQPSLKRKDLKKRIIDAFHCSDGTANNRLSEWLQNGSILKGPKKTSPYWLNLPEHSQLTTPPEPVKTETITKAAKAV